MKYLIDYIQEEESKVFKEYGAFFAFSEKQFNEQKQEGVVYANIGAGLLCPRENAEKLIDELDNIVKAGIAQDRLENTAKSIVIREIENHECVYTGNLKPAIEALEGYDIPQDFIEEIFSKLIDSQL